MTADEKRQDEEFAEASSAAARATLRALRDSPDGRRRWWPAPFGESRLEWSDLARLARARQVAGVELDDRDHEALRRSVVVVGGDGRES